MCHYLNLSQPTISPWADPEPDQTGTDHDHDTRQQVHSTQIGLLSALISPTWIHNYVACTLGAVCCDCGWQKLNFSCQDTTTTTTISLHIIIQSGWVRGSLLCEAISRLQIRRSSPIMGSSSHGVSALYNIVCNLYYSHSVTMLNLIKLPL